ncbi:Lin0512 family protein [Yoonia sp.]|uniref:Lin0512 family protein n=1 Tax=Yoonia sp. TaxID=2212373 RepID=UPI001A0E9E08|nr:Lin0512 family protein [Yoonia sp.]MBE0414564.1 Lin0512 family protein [Yoonia sp.]
MTEQRIIIEMGMGNDLHGMDYQKAARRAIEDAIRHSTLPIFESTDLSHDQMRVQVTVAVQEPDRIDTAALTTGLPRGRASVMAVKGGMNIPNPETGDTAVVATAAVEAFLPSQAGKWKRT